MYTIEHTEQESYCNGGEGGYCTRVRINHLVMEPLGKKNNQKGGEKNDKYQKDIIACTDTYVIDVDTLIVLSNQMEKEKERERSPPIPYIVVVAMLLRMYQT